MEHNNKTAGLKCAFPISKTVEILNWLWYDKLWISKRKRPLEGQNIHILKGHRKYMK